MQLQCAFCGAKQDSEEACILRGWEPYFWVGDFLIDSPVCSDCTKSHLEFSDYSDVALKKPLTRQLVYRWDFIKRGSETFRFLQHPGEAHLRYLMKYRPGYIVVEKTEELSYDPATDAVSWRLLTEKRRIINNKPVILMETVQPLIKRYEEISGQLFQDWSDYEDLEKRHMTHNAHETLRALEHVVLGTLSFIFDQYADRVTSDICATYVRDLAQLLMDIRQLLL